jgi:hypothetical protein
MDSTYEMVKELIDFNSEGVDTYNHNGSTWLIFTDQKKWVIELTKEKTLWYNYYFFTGVFKYLSLDVVENQHYITKWVEDTIINSVKSTKGEYYKEIQKVEYTIQNGVKDTKFSFNISSAFVENTIQTGVKKTKRSYEGSRKQRTKDTIQNGVKKTYSDKIPHEYDWTDQFTEEIEGIIQNGVKHTEKSLQIDGSCVIEDVLREGVKHTEYGDWLDGDERFDDIIKNGVKETHDDAYHHKGRVGGVIKNGVKETKSIDYSDNSEFIVDGVISKGVKKSPI